MTERPILFSGPMVRAILAGQKIVTRRILNPQPPDWATQIGVSAFTKPGHLSARGYHPEFGSTAETFVKRRFAIGDRLWVRETWMLLYDAGDGTLTCLQPSNEQAQAALRRAKYQATDKAPENFAARWRPSIHMPRWASRITLEVTGVAVERLQDLTEEQAQAEGIEGPFNVGYQAWRLPDDSKPRYSSARSAFERLWNDINGERPGCSWHESPWVWAVSFRMVTP